MSPSLPALKAQAACYKTGIGPPLNPAHTACFGFMAPDFFEY